MKPYYNHDHLWQRRHYQRKPVWGPHSEAAYHNILNRTLHLHPAAKTIFDAGCGAGAMGDLATKRGLAYWGADESGVAIEMGRKSFPHLNLLQHDLVKSIPPECAHTMCIITSVNVLHCLTEQADRLALLRNLRHLAKSDSLLALSTMCLPIRANHRIADSPRIYLEPEAIYREFAQSGWEDLILREFIPADEISPITNMLIIARQANGS